MWVVEDMVFREVIKKIASGFSRGKISNVELKFRWDDKKGIIKFPPHNLILFFRLFKNFWIILNLTGVQLFKMTAIANKFKSLFFK